MQRHFGGNLRQRLHEKVRCPHPRLHDPEGVLGSLTPHMHGLRVLVEPLLHRLRDVLVLPPDDVESPPLTTLYAKYNAAGIPHNLTYVNRCIIT
jgi:hypothetical protein